MEMKKLFTFICHDTASLYAISVSIENILFHMFSTALRDLSFLFNLWNLLHRNHCRALFIPLVFEVRPVTYSYLNDFR